MPDSIVPPLASPLLPPVLRADDPRLGQFAAMSGEMPAPADPKYWDPEKAGAEISLSNGNRTASMAPVSVNGAQVMGITSHASGSFYAEIKINNGSDWAVGLNVAASPLDGGYPGDVSGGIGYYGVDGSVYYSSVVFVGPTFGTGNTINIAGKLSTGDIWLGVDGEYLNSGDPGAGINPTISGLTPDTFFLCAASFTADGMVTVRTGADDFEYPIPSGFPPFN